jgi:hypothetical protein
MIIVGLIFKNHWPKEINYIYGYRTKRSMISQGTWDYANRRTGQLWFKIGITLLAVITISKFFIPIPAEKLSLIHTGVSLIGLFVSIPIIERELKMNFDRYGNPKSIQ